MSSLPEHLQSRRYYEATDRGVEARIREALERAREIRERRDGPKESHEEREDT